MILFFTSNIMKLMNFTATKLWFAYEVIKVHNFTEIDGK